MEVFLLFFKNFDLSTLSIIFFVISAFLLLVNSDHYYTAIGYEAKMNLPACEGDFI